jgi:hypothetical protein
LQASVDLLMQHYNNKDQSVSNAETIRDSLLLSLIGLGKFEQATKLFGSTRPAPQGLDIHSRFNYAMAEWGLKQKPLIDMFEFAAHLDPENMAKKDENYQQCMALSLWVIGKKEEALSIIEAVITKMAKQPHAEFSCWRYLTVTPEIFLEDCNSIRDLIKGKKIKPLFME